MFNGVIKFVIGTTLGVAIAFLIAFNCLLLWVATGPRSLDALSPYIEDSFAPPDNSFSVLIGETWLIWDGWEHPIDIRLRNVSVMTKDKQRFSKFPEISLGIDVFSLLIGRVLPTSLTITHPVLSLFQNDDQSISFGFHKEAADAPESTTAPVTPAEAGQAEEMTAVPFAAVLAPLLHPDENSSLRKLRLISVINADVSVGNMHKGVFFNASDVEMVFKSNRRGLQAFGSAKISYDNYQSMITAQLNLDKGSTLLEGDVDFSQLMPGTLADLFASKTLLGAMKFPVSGKGKMAMDTSGVLQMLNFAIDGGEGTIESDRLDGTVPVTALHAEGQFTRKADINEIQISKLNANLDGMLVDADGVASLKDSDTAIKANFYLKHIPAGRVHLLWPKTFAPVSREWVTANITEGISPQAESHFNIAFGDLAKPNLPKEDIDATIVLEGAKIKYLPEHPELMHVNGHLHVDGVSMESVIESGQYMKDTRMTGGKLVIEDINADNPYIKINFDADTSAKDVVRFLNLPRLKHAQRLNLQEETAEGTAKGHVAVGFTFFAPRDKRDRKDGDSDITYELTAELKNIAQPDFMKKFDIKNADGTMALNNTQLEFKGTGDVNGAHVSESDVKYLFKPEGGFDTIIEATANAPVEVLPRFGYPAFPFVKGTLGIKAKVKEGKGEELSQAAIDLTNATIMLPAIGWTKPDKEAASFDINAEKKEDVATIPSFHLQGRDINAQGSAELDKELSAVKRVSLDKLHLGDTDLDQVMYEKMDGGFKLSVHGKSADLAAWMDDTSTESSFSFAHFPAAQVNLDIAQVLFGKGRELDGVKGDLTCDMQRCSSANIAGHTIDNKPFNFRIMRNPKGNRQLSLHVQSAGAFLKAVNMFDGMEGGDLTVTGSYNDSAAASVLTGKADITEHTIKDAPVLAKILSLASFTGFFDTLVGKGITFNHLKAPFTLANDVITVTDAKTYGSAIGLTIEGTITFPKKTLDLQGTVVPSYTLNSVLGKVPLVGAVLTGGEGQGVFAARYSVRGSGREPDVSVNPLSILTPGFLRSLFDIFDRPDKKEETSEPEAETEK